MTSFPTTIDDISRIFLGTPPGVQEGVSERDARIQKVALAVLATIVVVFFVLPNLLPTAACVGVGYYCLFHVPTHDLARPRYVDFFLSRYPSPSRGIDPRDQVGARNYQNQTNSIPVTPMYVEVPQTNFYEESPPPYVPNPPVRGTAFRNMPQQPLNQTNGLVPRQDQVGERSGKDLWNKLASGFKSNSNNGLAPRQDQVGERGNKGVVSPINIPPQMQSNSTNGLAPRQDQVGGRQDNK